METVKKIRILVVEDAAPLRRLLALNLETLGYEVAQAASGESGLEMLHAREFDAIIADYHLGDMTGVTMLLLAGEKVRRAVLMSDQFQKATDVGVVHRLHEEINQLRVPHLELLPKPHEMEDLYAALARTVTQYGQITVVDADPANGRLLQVILEEQGFKVGMINNITPIVNTDRPVAIISLDSAKEAAVMAAYSSWELPPFIVNASYDEGDSELQLNRISSAKTYLGYVRRGEQFADRILAALWATP